MARCASCGTENPSGNRFCGECGAGLRASCRACGAAAQDGARFCAQCGEPLDGVVAVGGREALASPSANAAGASPAGDAPVSERRVCSVLFVDLVGFTPFAESRDPEDVRAVLSRYFDAARTVVTRYGGVVEKFIGDAVMAVWGTPVAAEGDTERAVRAALDLVVAVEMLGTEVGAAQLSARAGVVTGEVAVNIGASGEGMVAGDAVNTASRVQAVARPGSVLVDDSTRRLSESAVAFEDAGSHELKGKESPEHLSRAVRVLSGVGGRRRADGLEAPFTGRDVELRTLKDLFHAAAERKVPRLVVVSGPAGVGKSRLGWEFEKYIDGLADTVLWHRGRCLSYGEGIAFWALAEIVRQRFGIAEEDATETATSKLAEGLVRFVADEAERDYVGVRLGRLLGVAYRPETKVVLSKEELYAGWRLFFERLAQVAPVVMLVEDAQHADEGLLGFFEHLIDWTRDLPIFVLIFARPGLAAIDSGYGVGRNRSALSLDPLDDASMASLVDSLVPGMPDGARVTITARAQGVPLFAVETIRSLIDRGILVRDHDSYRLVGDLGALKVPDSLHALLAARLDALDPPVRALVADASVLGTSFPKEALTAVSNRSEEEVGRGLAELVRRDVLEVFADPQSPERGAYRFGQEMLRQVAYETLSRRDRKARHLAVAAHLRSAFAGDGEEIADAIARHYSDALVAGPDDGDAGKITSEALAFLVRAGERAERSGAPARAAASYAEAAAIAPADQAAMLFEKASRASFDYDDEDKTIAYSDAARERHLASEDRRGAARAQSLKARMLVIAGRHAAARVELSEALEVLRPEPDADTVEALSNLASLEVFSGNHVEAESLSTEALRLGQALDVPTSLLASVFITKGIAASLVNCVIEATAYFEAAARLAQSAGDLGVTALAQLDLADVLARRDPRSAVEAARLAADHARRTGQRGVLSYAIGNIVIAQIELGAWDEAADSLRNALDSEQVEDEILQQLDGWLAGLRGEGKAAAAALRSLSRRRDSEEPQAQAGIAVLEALESLCQGDVAEALAHAMRALEKREAVGMGAESQRWAWPLAARAARFLEDSAVLSDLVAMLEAHPAGSITPALRAEGQLVRSLIEFDEGRQAALDDVAGAISALRATGNAYQLAHGLVDYAGALRVCGDEESASCALEEARVIADRLRCAPLKDRVESAAPAVAR